MEKRLFKSSYNKKICGVCGGMAQYFNVDVILIRLIWIFFSLSYGSGILAYIIAAIIMPQENEHREEQACQY